MSLTKSLQNFFGVDAESARLDAGSGLVLLGAGHGGFRALRPQESGVAIHGEGRGAAVADFDGDGRMDIAVGVQGGATRLLRNVIARPGVRVTLRGPVANPDAIGAMVRLKFGKQFGAAREIHAGSGWWSQDSATLTLASPTEPSGAVVRWPGGQETTLAWPSGKREVSIPKDR